MCSLTEQQIAFIENDIKVRGITSPDLSIDVLDHICCIIETKLDEYSKFDTVYQETILLFGERGLKEIQDETTRLLTFKNNNIMNSTMKISGYVSSLMILSGAFFKFNHWPGANLLMVLGMFLLAVLFLPLLIILKFKSSEENNRSIVLSSIAGVASLLLCCGIVFKILHWPYAQILTIAGGVLLVLGYLPIYFISVYKATTNKINATATVTLIIAGVGLFVAQSNLGLSRPVSDTFWRGIVESNQLLSHLKKENELFYTKLENKIIAGDSSKSIDSIRELKSNTDALVNYIDDMKIYLIANTEGLSEADAKKIQLDALRKSGGIEIIQSILFNKGSSKFSSTDLKSRIENYKHLIKASSTTIDLSILETGMLEVYDKQVTWEQSNFDQLPIALVIFNLNRIELALKNIESSALIHLS
jgi:hypothetical protein